MAHVLNQIEFHEAVGQESNCPFRAPLRRLAAGHSDEVRFLPAVQDRHPPPPWPLAQSTFQAFLREAPANVRDRPRTHTHSEGYVFIFVAVIGCQQDMGPLQLARAGLPRTSHRFQPLSLA